MKTLAPYACDPQQSRGRRFDEAAAPTRSSFQRDRDRIVHSSAFRRLVYKTQVFVNHEGDLFRTRLTHSLEVAQLGRSIARSLRLEEDLVEAICLAHDLGHTPFGHAGQDALNQSMSPFGGFEHNLQSLRIVDVLEERYGAFDGLNLTFETREGILKHCSRANAEQLGELGERFLNGTQPSLEAQLTNIADAIAYSNHDIDDGLRSGILTIELMREVPLFAHYHNVVRQAFVSISVRREVLETVRRMINAMVVDLTEQTQRNVLASQVKSIDDVRHAPRLAAFSDEMYQHMQGLKSHLMKHLYRHYQVLRTSVKAQRMLTELFDAFMQEPRLLPPDYQAHAQEPATQARHIADYIAGMTDRYAMKEHMRLFSVEHS